MLGGIRTSTCCKCDAGGHYATRNTVIKIVNAGYWWPTMFKNVHEYVRRCDSCQRDDAATMATFLFESIITRYGCPLELVSDGGIHFLNKVIEDLTQHFQIKHRKTTPYNPKANGVTEKSNGLLCKILLKVTVNHSYDWDTKLVAALWAYRTAEKITTRQTPYFLVYGQHPILPIEFEVPTQRTLDTRRIGAEESQLYRLQEVMVLEERRCEAEERTRQIQLRRKERYDKKVKPVLLQKGDLALLYDSRHAQFPGKLHLRWMGPFRVIEKRGASRRKLRTSEADKNAMSKATQLRMIPLKLPQIGLRSFQHELTAMKVDFLLWGCNWVCQDMVREWQKENDQPTRGF
ncbi:hypothetical protein AXG93_4855s1040 [Marchantia polymorpha subsp. ruderalis]|uniref:Integrase catalytic domain-containing protein n=1 Tax=Marchantia polymorpha subsp. ruderalis TaxID=1480154 RepID=A0A176VQD6_MARPO|nr:hypothetical protein AXG93_4855s1040 [Marchantia polymorpha subsp. ruderalis]